MSARIAARQKAHQRGACACTSGQAAMIPNTAANTRPKPRSDGPSTCCCHSRFSCAMSEIVPGDRFKGRGFAYPQRRDERAGKGETGDERHAAVDRLAADAVAVGPP